MFPPIETSQLICLINQRIGIYVMGALVFNRLNHLSPNSHKISSLEKQKLIVDFLYANLHLFKKCYEGFLKAFTGAVIRLQFYNKETPTQVFFCEYCKMFKNTYFE